MNSVSMQNRTQKHNKSKFLTWANQTAVT